MHRAARDGPVREGRAISKSVQRHEMSTGLAMLALTHLANVTVRGQHRAQLLTVYIARCAYATQCLEGVENTRAGLRQGTQPREVKHHVRIHAIEHSKVIWLN